jgi:hypothetical protein
VSNTVGSNSPWLSSKGIDCYSRIDNVPLILFKDMRLIHHSDSTMQSDCVAPAERCQIGPNGWARIISDLSTGRSTGGVSDNARKVIVYDMHPEQGDIPEACWNLYSKWASGTDAPCFVYCAGFKADDTSRKEGLESHCQGLLLRTWWETHAEAGRPEPTHTAESAVSRPNFALLSWDTTGKPAVPELVYSRFAESLEYQASWEKFCDDLNAKASTLRGLRQCGGDGFVAGPSHFVNLTGPEISDGDASLDVNRILQLEEIPMADLDMSKVLLV